jgi:hypothetical protein
MVPLIHELPLCSIVFKTEDKKSFRASWYSVAASFAIDFLGKLDDLVVAPVSIPPFSSSSNRKEGVPIPNSNFPLFICCGIADVQELLMCRKLVMLLKPFYSKYKREKKTLYKNIHTSVRQSAK